MNLLGCKKPKNAMHQAAHIILLKYESGSTDRTMLIPCKISLVIGRWTLGGLEMLVSLQIPFMTRSRWGCQLAFKSVVYSFSYMDTANSNKVKSYC